MEESQRPPSLNCEPYLRRHKGPVRHEDNGTHNARRTWTLIVVLRRVLCPATRRRRRGQWSWEKAGKEGRGWRRWGSRAKVSTTDDPHATSP